MDEAKRPTIVCLCGSTQFYEAFQKANYDETIAGKIVLSVGFYPHAAERAHGQHLGCTDEQKIALDELHKRKIDLADEVLVLNVLQPWCPKCEKFLLKPGMQYEVDRTSHEFVTLCCQEKPVMRGYIGSSTRGEIQHAERTGKPVRYLEAAK